MKTRKRHARHYPGKLHRKKEPVIITDGLHGGKLTILKNATVYWNGVKLQ